MKKKLLIYLFDLKECLVLTGHSKHVNNDNNNANIR